jgi:hypothetical protein
MRAQRKQPLACQGLFQNRRGGSVCLPSVYLFFSLPRGMTAVIGAIGRSDVEFLGSEVSFLGFFAIFSLR